MSVHMTALVWEAKLSRDEKLIMLAYADHADPYGESIYPSQTTIERMTGYDLRSVKRITKKLVDAGYLVPVGQSHLGTNGYVMDTGKLEAKRGGAKIAPVTFGASGGCQTVQKGGDTLTPYPPVEPPIEPPEGDLFTSAKLEHPELPPVLRTPELLAHWAEWKQHRTQKRSKLTPIAMKKQVVEMLKWGPEVSVVAINHSIAKNYTGLFLPASQAAKFASPKPAGGLTKENALRMPSKGPQPQAQ